MHRRHSWLPAKAMKKEVIPLYEDENEAQDIIEMTDDEGNTILMQVVDYFFYNG